MVVVMDITSQIFEESGQKVCTKCGILKSLFAYAREKKSPDGYTAACKVCRNRVRYTEAGQKQRRAYTAKWERRKKLLINPDAELEIVTEADVEEMLKTEYKNVWKLKKQLEKAGKVAP